MPEPTITRSEDEKSIDRAEFIRDPGKAFRLASDGRRVAIVSADGRARAFLSVPQSTLILDDE